MGMLFNTDATLRMLDTVNATFRGLSFKQFFATNPKVSIQTFRALGTSTTTGIYSQAALPLGIDDFDPVISRRWQKWLGWLDSTTQSPGQTVSYVIGNAIADAIQGRSVNGTAGVTFNSVEFFVVPGPSGVSVSVGDVPEDSNSTTFTKVITIQTMTVDQFHK